MEIVVTDIPKCIKSFSFSPRVVLSEKTTIDYLIRMKEYIFGSDCCEAASKIGVSLFDLVFINDKSFEECCEMYLNKIRERDKDVIRTAFLLKKMYSGDFVRIAVIICENEKAYVKEPEVTYLNILNESPNDSEGKKKLPKRMEKKKNLSYNGRAKTVLESVRLSAVKYGMLTAIQYKELIDKYNFRRFSTNLKLNSRPISVEELTSALSGDDRSFLADLSNPKNRISFSVLYAIAYGGYKLNDLYAKNTVFEDTGFDKEKRFSELASDLINIVYNDNGMEVANMFLKIITSYAGIELPPVNMGDLSSIMDNYSMYYAAASLAAVCESIFKYDGINGELKQYLKKHTIGNYWKFMDRLMMIKQYSVVVAFCYKMAHFDHELYLDDPEYQAEILFAYERAEKFSRELKKNG